MKTEQEQLDAMYARVRQVFPVEFRQSLSPQQINLTESAMSRVFDKDGAEALTVDRLEGIKELVTQHLWSPALTEAAKSLPPLATGKSNSDVTSSEK